MGIETRRCTLVSSGFAVLCFAATEAVNRSEEKRIRGRAQSTVTREKRESKSWRDHSADPRNGMKRKEKGVETMS
jgi:hypothetical protein